MGHVTGQDVGTVSTFTCGPRRVGGGAVLLVANFIILGLFNVTLVTILFTLGEKVFVFLTLVLATYLLTTSVCNTCGTSGCVNRLSGVVTYTATNTPIRISLRDLPRDLGVLTSSLSGRDYTLRDTIVGTIGSRHAGARLVAGISRSLGAPLASIVGCVSLLRGYSVGSRTTRGCVTIVTSGTGELGGLVRSLVRTSGISSNGVILGGTLLSLGRLTARTVIRRAANFRGTGLRLIFRRPTHGGVISTSKTGLCHILRGLLSGTEGCSTPNSHICAHICARGSFNYFRVGGVSGRTLGVSTTRLARHFIHNSGSEGASNRNLKLSVTSSLYHLRNKDLSVIVSNSLFGTAMGVPTNGLGDRRAAT